MSGLSVRLRDVARRVAVDLSMQAGRTTALLGPNGAGKSTVLTAVAGTHRPDEVDVRLGGRDLSGLAAHRRRVALLAQDPLLLPHLDALDNVAFGPRAQGRGRREARRLAAGWLETVGATGLEDRRPAQLSGGQAQRVAIARALAAEPEALLLDEPLAALDVDAAPEIRHVLRQVLAGRTVVLVTHDVVDAALLADQAVVLEQGRVVESGPVTDLLSAPRTPFAARLAGTNLLQGRAVDGGLQATDGTVMRGIGGEQLAPGTAAVATFRPDTVAVHAAPPGGSPRTVLPGEVVAVEPSGSAVRLRVRSTMGVLVADLTPAAVAELDLRTGARVHLAVKAAAVRISQA